MVDGPQLFLKCQHCEKIFKYNGGKRRKFCSDKCKVAAWRQAAAEIKPVIIAESAERRSFIHHVQNDPVMVRAQAARKRVHVTDKPEQ